MTAAILPATGGDQPKGGPPAAVLDARLWVQISDHAPDSRFYGIVDVAFSEIDWALGSAEAVVWDDAKCHRERGLPKVTIVRLEGTVKRAAGTMAIHAMVRQLGLRLPGDEIVVRKSLEPTVFPTVLAIDATAAASGLAVRVKLQETGCRLP